MSISKLLHFLLTRCFSTGIVEAGAGGAVADEVDIEDDPGADDADADDADDTGDGLGADDQDDAGNADGEGEGDTDDGVVISLGDDTDAGEEGETRAPEWVRELRKSNREKDRRIRELEQKVATITPAQQAIVVGDKPTLASCDYDSDKYEADIEAWHTRKREADEQQRTRTQADEQQRAHWQTRIDAVNTAAKSLKVKDYEDASQAFDDTFSIVQQGIVAGGPDDPKTSALLRYALGRNPKKAKELAAIRDPVKFSFAVAKLETQLKVTPRKSAPAPDRQVRSSVAGAAAVDSQLARLQAEADKTGNRTKVAAYMREKNKAKQAA